MPAVIESLPPAPLSVSGPVPPVIVSAPPPPRTLTPRLAGMLDSTVMVSAAANPFTVMELICEIGIGAEIEPFTV